MGNCLCCKNKIETETTSPAPATNQHPAELNYYLNNQLSSKINNGENWLW